LKHLVPPTLINTNEFTWAFQEIVDTYGTPCYQEFNPATYACVTFPFLFGIMFGDIGHGGCLLLLGIFLCLFGSKVPSISFMMPFRYILLLMGCFATFAGLVYNDMMAIPLQLFDSCYVDGEPKQDCVYPFGIDYMWYGASNELAFQNSLKMKLAVILGVAHMTCGILLKGANSLFKRNYIDFFCEFVPQLLLMWVLFGYMDVLIVLKWLKDFTHIESRAPSIVTAMIDVFLNGGVIPDNNDALLVDKAT